MKIILQMVYTIKIKTNNQKMIIILNNKKIQTNKVSNYYKIKMKIQKNKHKMMMNNKNKITKKIPKNTLMKYVRQLINIFLKFLKKSWK